MTYSLSETPMIAGCRLAEYGLFTNSVFCKECAILSPCVVRLFERAGCGAQRAKCKE